MKYFKAIVEQIGKQHNIKVQALSDDWILVLSKEKKTRYIIGYKFDLNTQATACICDDKYALYDIIKRQNIPVIEHSILFQNEYEKLKQQFYHYRKNIVLKANDGTCGNEVYHIKEENKLKEKYERLSKHTPTLSVCPYYEVEKEYRVIYLEGVEYIYEKQNAKVVGDGKKTVKELLQEFNPTYYNNQKNLKKQTILSYVPKQAQEIVYDWRFNLQKGAVAKPASKEIQNVLSQIATKVATAIHLKFGSIDIIQTKKGEMMVMETNSGVMMENMIEQIPDGETIAYTIYEKAILKMFEQ